MTTRDEFVRRYGKLLCNMAGGNPSNMDMYEMIAGQWYDEASAALRAPQQPNNEAIERVAIALCNLDPEHEWDTRTPMQKKLYRYKAREAISAFLASRQEKKE